jgi:phage gp36-like protein
MSSNYCTQQDLEHHISVAQLKQLTNDAWDESPPANVALDAISGGELAAAEYYVVTALNEKGETIQSEEVTFTPDNGDATASLSWDAVATATNYKIYRSAAQGVYTSPSLVAQTTELTYDDDGSTDLLIGAPKSDNSMPDATIVNDMIQMADNEINAKVGCTYSVPFVAGSNCVSIPLIIKELSQDMSLYNCFMRRISGFEVPKQWIEAYKDACKKLQDIAEMSVYLDGSPTIMGKEAEIVTETDDKILDFNDDDSSMSSY